MAGVAEGRRRALVGFSTGVSWPFLASLTFSEASLKIAKFWMFCPGFQANPTLSLAWNRSDSCTVARGEIAASFSQNVVRIPTSGQDRQTDRQTARHTDRQSPGSPVPNKRPRTAKNGSRTASQHQMAKVICAQQQTRNCHLYFPVIHTLKCANLPCLRQCCCCCFCCCLCGRC